MAHTADLDQANTLSEIDTRIERVLALMNEKDFQNLTDSLAKRFGLVLSHVDSHPLNIKTIIRGKNIAFSNSVSPASKTFMLLHSLGHYYFICEAKRKKIERYSYIYDLRGVQAALHYYETEGQGSGLDAPPPMTDDRRKDRVSFEVGANNFAIDLLSALGFKHLMKVIESYSIGDINYILEVSKGGKKAIVPNDRAYLEEYVCAGLSIDPDDTYDDGVYSPESFSIDAIDWAYIEEIKLEIHFF
jgi:hypothetical protein